MTIFLLVAILALAIWVVSICITIRNSVYDLQMDIKNNHHWNDQRLSTQFDHIRSIEKILGKLLESGKSVEKPSKEKKKG